MRRTVYRLSRTDPVWPRRFKIGGYTLGGGDWKGPPVAAMYMSTFTLTRSPTRIRRPRPDCIPTTTGSATGVRVSSPASFYGNLGSFIQITGDPTVAGTCVCGCLRTSVTPMATLKLFGKDTIWGIDANTPPTVQDPWNTTPSFGWPQISSTIAPAFGPPLTHIENGYGQIVGGAGAYVFWNYMLYGDLIALLLDFRSPCCRLSHRQLGRPTRCSMSRPIGAWRSSRIGATSAGRAGTFGMYGRVTPGRVYGFGTDNFLDVGFDSQIQYAGDQYSITVKLTDIMEWQRLNSSFAQGVSSNLNNTLNSFKANASFVWDHTYSVGFGYFNIAGSSDCNLYGSGNNVFCTPASIGSFNNSFISSPNGSGLIQDLAYLPFSHGAPFPYSTWNVRIGLQFTEYLHLYGGTTNFDGSNLGGTHNAQGNNSVFAYAWFAF